MGCCSSSHGDVARRTSSQSAGVAEHRSSAGDRPSQVGTTSSQCDMSEGDGERSDVFVHESPSMHPSKVPEESLSAEFGSLLPHEDVGFDCSGHDDLDDRDRNQQSPGECSFTSSIVDAQTFADHQWRKAHPHHFGSHQPIPFEHQNITSEDPDEDAATTAAIEALLAKVGTMEELLGSDDDDMPNRLIVVSHEAEHTAEVLRIDELDRLLVFIQGMGLDLSLLFENAACGSKLLARDSVASFYARSYKIQVPSATVGAAPTATSHDGSEHPIMPPSGQGESDDESDKNPLRPHPGCSRGSQASSYSGRDSPLARQPSHLIMTRTCLKDAVGRVRSCIVSFHEGIHRYSHHNLRSN